MKQTFAVIIWGVTGLTLALVGALVPASIYFPEPVAWICLVCGFLIITLACRMQLIPRARREYGNDTEAQERPQC